MFILFREMSTIQIVNREMANKRDENLPGAKIFLFIEFKRREKIFTLNYIDE